MRFTRVRKKMLVSHLCPLNFLKLLKCIFLFGNHPLQEARNIDVEAKYSFIALVEKPIIFGMKLLEL